MLTIKITNEALYFSKVDTVDLSGLHVIDGSDINYGLRGKVTIHGASYFTNGEFGASDFEKEYGFVIEMTTDAED